MAEQSSSETGSVSAEPPVPASSDVASEPAAASLGQATDVESPKLVSELAEAGEAPKVDASKAEGHKIESHKIEAQQADSPKQDAPKADAAHAPGKVMIMSPGDRAWDSKGSGPEVNAEPSSGMFGKRRLGALAAVAVLAAATGALGGALATAGLGHFLGESTATASA